MADIENESEQSVHERAAQALTKAETLTDALLEHLTTFDNRLEQTMQQLEATMNARIEARVKDELAKRGITPTEGNVLEGS
jgi:hypothetical protein